MQWRDDQVWAFAHRIESNADPVGGSQITNARLRHSHINDSSLYLLSGNPAQLYRTISTVLVASAWLGAGNTGSDRVAVNPAKSRRSER